MARFTLSRAAKRDLVEIGRYTLAQWGLAQARRYLTQLDERMDVIASEPSLGRTCDDIRAGYRCVHEGRHVLFYRLGDEGVEVIRILHERILPKRHV